MQFSVVEQKQKSFLPVGDKGWTETEKYSKIYIRNVVGKYSCFRRTSIIHFKAYVKSKGAALKCAVFF